MSGVEDAAAAVHGVLPVRGVFPAKGVVVSCRLDQDVDGAVVGIIELRVRVNGFVEDCNWSGALLAEIGYLGLDGSKLIGRDVKVELFGGDLVAAYTINGS